MSLFIVQRRKEGGKKDSLMNCGVRDHTVTNRLRAATIFSPDHPRLRLFPSVSVSSLFDVRQSQGEKSFDCFFSGFIRAQASLEQVNELGRH